MRAAIASATDGIEAAPVDRRFWNGRASTRPTRLRTSGRAGAGRAHRARARARATYLPGNIGVASGALAVALHSRGIGVTQALGIGIAIQALETVVSLTAGTAGALYFAKPNRLAGRWALRVAAVGLSGGLAVLLGAIFFDLT